MKRTSSTTGSSVAAPRSLTKANTIIVGAGAAGMACAAHLVRFLRCQGVKDAHKRVLVVTAGRTLGASRMSGSDKQTFYKMGTSPSVPDTAEDFASTLTAFGCCHGDTALIEGVASLRCFYQLVDAGVPFPHDPSGAFIGYKTDHDPYERATSAGPKTSKFMAELLEDEVRRLGVKILDHLPVVEFVTAGQDKTRHITAMICLDASRSSSRPALRAFAADNWVLAGGGPGEIYRDTVYPRGQIGLHGPTLRAGLAACNLTESQFGLASIKFRWNVSGTYMQVVPRIFSTDADGKDPREFLTEYFPDTQTMAGAIFLKGYQWPFDAQRLARYGSSLIDLAVHQETIVRGRRVWMDFTRNPAGAKGWQQFSLNRLPAEALDYLRKAGAMQATPIERLAHMNTPAIEIYAEHHINLHREPLEIAVCAQHNNGGFAVDKWWRSNVSNVFVIGEMAGTHGVKRPGGSALNAGQVGALRTAEFIAHSSANGNAGKLGGTGKAGSAAARGLAADIRGLAAGIAAMLSRGRKGKTTPREAIAELQERMTRYGAHLRSLAGAREALKEAVRQYRRLADGDLRIATPRDLLPAVQTLQQCLTHVAFLKASCEMLHRGGGSRGSHCVLADDGAEVHPKLIDPATGKPYRVKAENESMRNEILQLQYDSQAEDMFSAWTVPLRPAPRHDAAFETAWAEFRSGEVFRK